jgi:PAS domain S-box-containing protein
MPPIRKQFGIASVFAILAILVVFNAAITRTELNVQIEKRQLVAHTQEVLLQISQTTSSLAEAETGQRAFLLTNNPTHLQTYNEAITEVKTHLQQLLNLTRDDAQQRDHARDLETLTAIRLKQLAETLALAQSGHVDQARALVMSNRGKSTMEQIRAVTDQMWQAESARESMRSAEFERSAYRTTVSIYIATLAAVTALVLVAFYVLRSLHERERHAAILREREQWFRVTLGSIGDGVLATDASGRVTFINQVAANLIGITHDEAAGRPISDVLPIFNENTLQPVENPATKVLAEGKIVGLANHTVLKSRDGRLIPIEDSAAPILNDQRQIIGVVLVFRDATFERHSQDMLRRAEKLATAGRLAATMAHEINNPLEAVGNLIYIAKSSTDLRQEIRAYLDEAERQLERVSYLTRQTLGFYRESAEPSQVDIPVVIDSVLNFYEYKLNVKRITVHREFGECPAIYGLTGELRQMLANLVSNALDALPFDGHLTVSAHASSNEHNSRGVEIRIQDDGCGIAPENMPRIFEPFFTTKADVGTGLGLWVTKQIAERHGGTVNVQSRTNGEERGTVFSVFLPEHHAANVSAAAG